MGKTVEFRGCDNLVYAEVLTDDANGITFGAVAPLAPVAEIAKTVENSSETHYYDNVGQIVIRSHSFFIFSALNISFPPRSIPK